MPRRWKIVQTEAKTEVWVESTAGGGPVIYGVTRGPGEPLTISPGIEIYGLDRELFDLMFASVIRPALAEEDWDLGKVLGVLSSYLNTPGPYAPLLALVTGRVHLASRVSFVSVRLSDVFIGFFRRWADPDGITDRIVLATWCYQLSNAFFVAAKTPLVAKAWIRAEANRLDNTVLQGLDRFMLASRTMLGQPGQLVAEQLSWLKQEISPAAPRSPRGSLGSFTANGQREKSNISLTHATF
jgi:hypothetical protein